MLGPDVPHTTELQQNHHKKKKKKKMMLVVKRKKKKNDRLYLFLSVADVVFPSCSMGSHRLVGLVVKRPPRERKVPGSNPACDGIFPGSSHTSDFKIGTPVATLPGAWRYRVSTGTGRPAVSIL